MKSGEVFDYENEKLKNTIAIINQEIARLESKFEKEMHTIIGFKEGQRGTQFNRQAMMSLYATHVYNLKFILNNPYFCRFDFTQEGETKPTKIYMGKKNITDGNSNTIIYDWRSPLCSMYYDYNIGDAEYLLSGEKIKGNISLKRQIIIKDGKLENVEEQDSLSDDNVLMLYLTEHADARLKTIIATIQREQNKIIRSPLNDNYIIQGVAGSGKTTVALHRIAYLLYNEAKTTDESEFMIIGPNKYFLNYISSLLPELDITNVSQNTFEQLALNNLKCKYKIESKNTTLQKVLNKEIDPEIIRYKNSLQFMKLVENYVNDYIKMHLQQDVVYEGVTLSSKSSVSRIYDNQYDNDSYLEKVNKYVKMISSRVKEQQEELCHQAWMHYRNDIVNLAFDDPKRKELIGKVDDIQKEIKTGCKNFLKDYFKFVKVNPINLYQSFIENIDLYQDQILVDINSLKKYTLDKLNNKEVSSDDLSPILLMNQLLSGTKTNDHYTHLVIDEAQDLSLPQYYMLKAMFPKAKFDVYGDINQSIYDYQSVSNWNDLNKLIFNEKAEMLELNKSYRTTTQISDSSKLILDELHSPVEAECIARDGDDIDICYVDDDNHLINRIVNQIDKSIQKGFETIAIICKDDKETDKIYNILKKAKLKINRISESNTNYVGGICIMPSYLSKGLEFDSVIISNANDEYYTDSSIDLKLLYVSITRAMHELCINYSGKITKSLESLAYDFDNEDKVYKKIK